MCACPTLTTDRLVLRPFREDDLDPFFVMMTTEEVRRSLHVPESFSPGDAWTTLLRFAGLWELKGLGHWALEERVSGRFIGRAGLLWRPDDDWPGVEVGWMLDPSAWGSGYAGEAGARAVRYGFEELDEPTLHSLILAENTRSQAVARRLGFRPGPERSLSFFPSIPHVIWHLERDRWASGTDAG